MNEQFAIESILKHYGLPGIFLLFLPSILHFAYNKWEDKKDTKESADEKRRKIESGEWITYQDFKAANEKVEELRDQMDVMTGRINDHLEKEALEDIKMAKIEIKQDHSDDRMNKIELHVEKIFDMLGEIKTMLIKQRE